MLKREIDTVVEQSRRRLDKVAIPAVRYWLQVFVEGRDPEDRDVRRTDEEARRYPPRLKLLETLREDGTWPISHERRLAEEAGPGPPYGWTYTTMLRNLYWLFEYRTDPDEGYIQNSLEKILSWQDEEGYIKGPMADMIPRPYYNGLTLSILVRYGRKPTEPRITKIIDWIMRMQRHDGGWNIPYLEDVKYLPEYRDMRLEEFLGLVAEGKTPKSDPKGFTDTPSCYWSSVGVLRCLAWMNDHPLLDDFRRGGSFVLDGFFKKNPHKTFLQSEKNWTILKFPTYFGSGLTALDALVYLGFGPNDSRMDRPIRWLLGARSKDGFWYQTDRPHKLNDQWITVSALMILSYYSRMY